MIRSQGMPLLMKLSLLVLAATLAVSTAMGYGRFSGRPWWVVGLVGLSLALAVAGTAFRRRS